MTQWRPKPSLDHLIGAHDFYPVTVAAAEAAQLLPFVGPLPIGAQTESDRRRGSTTDEPAAPLLVYVPFDQNPSEFFHRRARVTLFRGALRHGRNL